MKITRKLGILAAGAVVCFTALTPISARADSQYDKNNYRNLALASGAVALYGIADHNSAVAAIGAIGAVVAGSQYERDRQDQDQCGGGYYYRHDDRNWQGGDYHGSVDYHADHHFRGGR